MADELNNETMTDTSENNEDGIVLSLNDIQNAVKVIDFAADQGAFKGWKTIEQVLHVRQRLNSFLETAQAAQETASSETETAETADA
ncbi:MAG: hypothetical protein EOO77_13855 [Oxalobacteraceae bacterium]|nr:MAG: hypothetical protein EOO77_13855 [Oxalobacteraceae bacterium]